MSEKGYGGRFFDKVAKERGLSKSRIYKILALQRLCDEVKKLGDEGRIRESALLEISKIETPARQKLVADLVVDKNLTVDQVREFSKLVRAAEKSPPDKANDLWDEFFELKDAIESKGMTDSMADRLKKVADKVEVAPESIEDQIDPELRKSLGFPDIVECLTGRGLDVGTTNIVSAGRPLEGEIHYVLQRNAFLDVRNDSFTKRMLIKLGIDHVMHENRMYVIGDPAFELANIFEKETRRPMKDGLISPLETDAIQMVSMIIHQVLGPPREPGELIYYCIPADPIDADRNVIYHRGALETIIRRQGFIPKSIIEGHAVVLSELEAEDFTGIGISCGGGMFNVCIAYKSVPALTFSTARGGDWVDINVGKALGIPASQATAIKEGGVDLTHPRNRQEEAICIYYRELIHYTLTTMQRQMESVRDLPAFTHPVELVCAGGTSLIKGFIQVFEEEYQKVLFPVEVKRIRLARDPLRSVALGCLTAAREEMAARTGHKTEPEAPTLQTGRVAAPTAETLAEKLKEPKGHPKKKVTSEGDDVAVLPPPSKLPWPDSDAPGRAKVEEKVVFLPTLPAKPKKTGAGPEEKVVTLPKVKEPTGSKKGPEEKVLPPVSGLAAESGAAGFGAARPVGQVVSLPEVPETSPVEAVPAEAQPEILPPVREIAAGEARAEIRPAEEVVQLPAEPLEAAPETPAADQVVVEEYPTDAIEQALAAAAAMGIGGEPILEKVPGTAEPVLPEGGSAEGVPAEGVPAEGVPTEGTPAEGATDQAAAEQESGVELSPFIQESAPEGAAPQDGGMQELGPGEEIPVSGEPTEWMSADENGVTPEQTGEVPAEASPESNPEAPAEAAPEEPPPLPPAPNPPKKPKR